MSAFERAETESIRTSSAKVWCGFIVCAGSYYSSKRAYNPVLLCVTAVDNNPFSSYHYIPDGRTRKRKYDVRQKVFRRRTSYRGIVEIDCEKICRRAGFERSPVKTDTRRATRSRAGKQSAREG
jgi:hypothetical protein